MKNFLRFFVMMILMTFPVPLLMGQGFIHDDPLKVFLGLSLIIPMILLSIESVQKYLPLQMNRGLLFYWWLFWTIFFATGTVRIHYTPSDEGFWLIHLGVLLAYLFIYLFSTYCGTLWWKRSFRPIWSKIVDMSLFAFPLPIVLMGNILYDALDPETAMMAFTMIYQLIYMSIILMVMLTMAVIVFSLMPPLHSEHKTVRILQILVTAMLWLGVNMYVVWGYLPQFVVDQIKWAMPIFTNSMSVYFTPMIFEVLVLAMSVYGGYGFAKFVFALLKKYKNIDEPIVW